MIIEPETPRAGPADPQGDEQVPRREARLPVGRGRQRGGTRGRALQGRQVAGLVLRQLRQLKKNRARAREINPLPSDKLYDQDQGCQNESLESDFLTQVKFSLN